MVTKCTATLSFRQNNSCVFFIVVIVSVFRSYFGSLSFRCIQISQLNTFLFGRGSGAPFPKTSFLFSLFFIFFSGILILSFCFAISTPAPTGSLFSVFSSLTHCFHSQMETKRTAVLLFCFLLPFFLCVFLCFVVGSVSVFLSYVDCSASAFS